LPPAIRAQADALDIEAQAKRRLADEYDAAQDRGEIAKSGDTLRKGPGVPKQNSGKMTAADVGLSTQDIFEARQIRDAEKRDPGVVRRNGLLDARSLSPGDRSLAFSMTPPAAPVRAARILERVR
jgi:hypothetical protein